MPQCDFENEYIVVWTIFDNMPYRYINVNYQFRHYQCNNVIILDLDSFGRQVDKYKIIMFVY